jgi:hypothetical protein
MSTYGPESPPNRGIHDEPPRTRRLLAEFFGMFALVFVAVGGDAASEVTDGMVGNAARAVAPGEWVRNRVDAQAESAAMTHRGLPMGRDQAKTPTGSPLGVISCVI